MFRSYLGVLVVPEDVLEHAEDDRYCVGFTVFAGFGGGEDRLEEFDTGGAAIAIPPRMVHKIRAARGINTVLPQHLRAGIRARGHSIAGVMDDDALTRRPAYSH